MERANSPAAGEAAATNAASGAAATARAGGHDGAAPTATTHPAGRKPVLEMRDVHKRYEHEGIEVIALQGVNLEIFPGELLTLLGPSGSGKSTLLNLLGGLDAPTSGVIRYIDRPLLAEDDDQLTAYRRRHVGFVFQFYNLIPSLTALENVTLVTEVAESPMPPAEALELVGLGKRGNHFPSQMSGGEQQRVAIARAIAKRPDLLLCDEPTGALDKHTGLQVLEAIDAINRRLGTPTILITHNAVMADMADRVLRMSDGRIVDIRVNATRRPVRELDW
jgi:putative ABC transport system ATP-binding protein